MVVNDTGDTISVEAFTEELGSIPSVRICTVAVAYDHPSTGHPYILFFPQSLVTDALAHPLLNPFQLRANGIEVSDVPLQHLDSTQLHPTDHSITVPEHQLIIPLSLEGTMSGFETRQPTWLEVQDTDGHTCTHVHMTSDAPWEPKDPTYKHIEDALRANLERDQELRLKVSRNLSRLQARGQVSGSADEDDSDLPMPDADAYDSDDEDVPPLVLGVPGCLDYSSSDADDNSDDPPIAR